ncbi:hypothetical protein D3C80_804700 [compost metagenome]
MKQVLVVAHPRSRSFTLAMAEAYAEAARAEGAKVDLRDLYRMGFDPVLHAQELPGHDDFAPRADVVAERAALADADLFAFFYPLWFNAPPAMLKGYVERVFGMGFGYSPFGREGNRPLLAGRKLVSFTSSGAPQHWVERSGAWDAMHRHFDDHFAAVTGLESLGHFNIGGVGTGLRDDVVARHAQEVAERARAITRAHP